MVKVVRRGGRWVYAQATWLPVAPEVFRRMTSSQWHTYTRARCSRDWDLAVRLGQVGGRHVR